MENTQKQPFYIFLDFDGVLNDFEGTDNIFKKANETRFAWNHPLCERQIS